MKFKFFLLLTALGASSIGFTQEAPLPKLYEGDKWTYNIKIDQTLGGSTSRKWELAIVRAGSSNVVMARKPTDSNLPPQEFAVAPDWSRSASINGKLTTTLKNFDFPIKPGKSWDVSFTEDKPNDKVKLTKRSFQYKVIGWEDVKVPAGTFKALKIEADGDWYNEFLPVNAVAGSRVESGATGNSIVMQSRNAVTPEPMSGKYYKAFWYAPEVKREVKSIEETFTPKGNVSNRITVELDSYLVQP